ncbi:MurR/RpiR family transcriptional regulator [Brenneria goodwinii]|uniref:MurR/RpiR family transcriptional regulator n=1 Tax=Brenneria goodwinii TaxID=1109412 RepID=UPI000EF20DBA|nr:MurR/RpiR family transcriptional regulator [Brenneria goodwinii]MCG8156747.1 MurR/RpiR family transcriptional regulator [Brenneria goodwinii]MCG8160227.1 MurR/RpiR family transcriptional regulator [Brenneria goodwinii]MCG8164750.1 MurR/RpiR family transcriptional regulator [Brenneria goodwinii]MCG8171580.1 MurR/RpiR family transcriptional regulator [Brenneria goodwinii]MCG8174072.1 MurR/RpiR family transcriptional regulator [Brenneria goodwinii]
MNKTEFSQRIAQLDNLTETDKRIVAYFDKHFLSIPYSKFIDICKEINIAKSTLGRFMIKIGFNGFQDFKQSTIKPELRRNISPIERFNRENNINSGAEYIEGYFGKISENINNTLEKINKKDLEKAVDLICDPQKRLYVIGSATAHALAEYFYLLGRYIKRDIVLLDANIANLPHKLVDSRKGDVLLAISYYRFSSVTTRLVRWFHQNRGDTVVITNRDVNPFSHFATALLLMDSQHGGLFNSRSSGFVLVEALVNYMGEVTGNELGNNFDVMESLFEEFNVFNK